MMKAFYTPGKEPMRVACLMSGSGTNVRKIIEKQLSGAPFRVAAIFTDNKESNAARIASEYNIPFMCNDIKDHCLKKGVERRDMNARRAYDSETRKFLEKRKADVVALCGYRNIVTPEIFSNFLTVNVHPADLRILDVNGRRLYAGCEGAGCVRKAIENTAREVRATTHLVTKDVDGGPILMVSGPAKIDEKLSDEQNLERLKEQGDWKIYPETIKRLAEGRFSADEKGMVYLDGKAVGDSPAE